MDGPLGSSADIMGPIVPDRVPVSVRKPSPYSTPLFATCSGVITYSSYWEMTRYGIVSHEGSGCVLCPDMRR